MPCVLSVARRVVAGREWKGAEAAGESAAEAVTLGATLASQVRNGLRDLGRGRVWRGWGAGRADGRLALGIAEEKAHFDSRCSHVHFMSALSAPSEDALDFCRLKQ
eukprot:6185838-Pleurochrysis_carterae.AAC.3